MVSTDERCQRLFCQSCAQIHENSFNHDIFRAHNLDYIISTGTFVCTLRDVPKIYLHHCIVNIRGRARTKDLRVQYVIMDLPWYHWGHIFWENISSTITSLIMVLPTLVIISPMLEGVFLAVERKTLYSSLEAQPFILYGLVHQLLLHLKRLLLHQRLQISNWWWIWSQLKLSKIVGPTQIHRYRGVLMLFVSLASDISPQKIILRFLYW